MLALEALSVRFMRWGQEVPALRNVTIDVAGGSWVALVGHNGSGKTTLIRAVAGLIRPDAGRIWIDGFAVERLRGSQATRLLFLLHQNPLLGTAPLLTPIENVRVASPHRLSVAEARALVKRLGLGERADQPARLLSGGERQLLALGIAELRAPRLLLLDEPFAALDPDKQCRALDVLRGLHRAGATIIQVTHQLDALTRDLTRIVRLNHGMIVGDEARDARPHLVEA